MPVFRTDSEGNRITKSPRLTVSQWQVLIDRIGQVKEDARSQPNQRSNQSPARYDSQ